MKLELMMNEEKRFEAEIWVNFMYVSQFGDYWGGHCFVRRSIELRDFIIIILNSEL